MVTGCHGYRNTTYLNEEHVDAAVEALKAHAFVGLLEAYNSSVLLAAAEFGVTNLEEDDFAQSRPSAALRRTVVRLGSCGRTPTRVELRSRPMLWIMSSMNGRIGCSATASTSRGCWSGMTFARSSKKDGCGDVDYSNVEHVCGPLETPAAYEKLKTLRAACVPGGLGRLKKNPRQPPPLPRPRRWLGTRYGYHYDGGRTPVQVNYFGYSDMNGGVRLPWGAVTQIRVGSEAEAEASYVAGSLASRSPGPPVRRPRLGDSHAPPLRIPA